MSWNWPITLLQHTAKPITKIISISSDSLSTFNMLCQLIFYLAKSHPWGICWGGHQTKVTLAASSCIRCLFTILPCLLPNFFASCIHVCQTGRFMLICMLSLMAFFKSCLFQKREVTHKGICYPHLVISVIKYTFLTFILSPWDKSRLQDSFFLRPLTWFWEKTSLFHWLHMLQIIWAVLAELIHSHSPPKVYTDLMQKKKKRQWSFIETGPDQSNCPDLANEPLSTFQNE